MIDIKKVSQNFFSQKKNIIILILLIVLVLLGVFFYKKYKASLIPPTEEEKIQEMINTAAEDAVKINLTEEDRINAMDEALKAPGHTLPPKEAKAREAEIIKSLYQ
ncbi:MAG: hypothetical protein KBD48_02310 [Candidatus Pacebacteria bacterium]|nr:hypothetical protein [Candidatus Paceibacterota bacterium]